MSREATPFRHSGCGGPGTILLAGLDNAAPRSCHVSPCVVCFAACSARGAVGANGDGSVSGLRFADAVDALVHHRGGGEGPIAAMVGGDGERQGAGRRKVKRAQAMRCRLSGGERARRVGCEPALCCVK